MRLGVLLAKVALFEGTSLALKRVAAASRAARLQVKAESLLGTDGPASQGWLDVLIPVSKGLRGTQSKLVWLLPVS